MDPLKQYTEALPDGIKQTANAEKEPDVLLLKAGKLKMIFTNGALKYISVGENELVRMIFAAVRDRDWLTLNPLVYGNQHEIETDSFSMKYTSRYISEEIDFTADFRIEGNRDSTLIFSMGGIANSTFHKNRIGLNVLHPVEGCAGNNCIVEHIDGSEEESFFPEEISPHQVFRDIKSLKWLSNSIICRLEFEGDVFETEDHRNWTDASFKTYSTPLSDPFPVIIKKGTRISQKLTFTAEIPDKRAKAHDGKPLIKLSPKELFKLPAIGICKSSNAQQLSKTEIKMLRALRFDHYRTDLHLYLPGWHKKAEQATNESSLLGFPIEFALFFDDNFRKQAESFIKWYSGRRPAVSIVLIFHRSSPSTPDTLASEVITLLRKSDPDIKTATGTNANFAQLNRNRPGKTGNDFICYSIHPQEHASDNATLIENLRAQEYTVKNARRLANEKGLIISPVTLQRRFNANNTFVELPWTGYSIPPQIDSRMMSLFGACWTAGSLKYLMESGINGVTYYETAGERGIFQGAYPSRWPSDFQSYKGMVFPVFHVFRFILKYKNLNIVPSESNQPLKVNLLSLTDGKEFKMILINFTSKPIDIHIPVKGKYSVKQLNSDTFTEASADINWIERDSAIFLKADRKVHLSPFSISFIE